MLCCELCVDVGLSIWCMSCLCVCVHEEMTEIIPVCLSVGSFNAMPFHACIHPSGVMRSCVHACGVSSVGVTPEDNTVTTKGLG